MGPIQFSILFLTLQSARQITGILCESLVSELIVPCEYIRENLAQNIKYNFRNIIKTKTFIWLL
jgi:hypothetical protein